MSELTHFSGPVRVEWTCDGRYMQLLEPLVYVDSCGRRWTAPAGYRTDGASIPRFFWRVIGSPFVGKYRRAAVIHDVYCSEGKKLKKNKVLIGKDRKSPAIHKLFHEMMLTDGTSRLRARVMYLAVRICGPRF